MNGADGFFRRSRRLTRVTSNGRPSISETACVVTSSLPSLKLFPSIF